MINRLKKISKEKIFTLLIVFLVLIIVSVVFIFKNSRSFQLVSAFSIDDFQNQKVDLIIKRPGIKDLIINEENYLTTEGGEVSKGIFYNFVVSPNDKYLFYANHTNINTVNFFLFDIDNGVNNYLDFDINNQAFTKNSRYFYACGNEVIIYRLPDLKIIYRSTKKGTFFTCAPSKDPSKITFSEFQNKNDPEPTAVYQLSQFTGYFKQTK